MNSVDVGTAIAKGELRFGTVVDFRGIARCTSPPRASLIIFITIVFNCAHLHTRSINSLAFSPCITMCNSAWRHWGCVNSETITNMTSSMSEASEHGGYKELGPEDQKVSAAFAAGKVADEDIPESAEKPGAQGKKRKKMKRRGESAGQGEGDRC